MSLKGKLGCKYQLCIMLVSHYFYSIDFILVIAVIVKPTHYLILILSV